MSSVTISQVSKSFGNQRVLNDISLTIDHGKFITLLGPSGCGKSTLLRCIAGLNDVDEGSIFFDDCDVTHVDPRKREIGMVFQNYALFPNLNVRENIAFGLRVRKTPEQRIGEEVDKYIALVDLIGKEAHYPHQLSGGQKQRVALARALILKPKILLLDEPLSALDAKIRKALRLQIRSIQKSLNITTIFVTHDQEEALIVSDEIFVMEGGVIAQHGSSEHIYTQPASPFVAGFIGNYNVMTAAGLSAFKNCPTVEDAHALRPEVIRIKPVADVMATDITPDTAYAEGVVKDVLLLGSILRFCVDVEGTAYTVDVLNRGEDAWLEVGCRVVVAFSKKHLQRLVN